MYNCEKYQIYDHYKTPPGCVSLYSTNGTKVLERKSKCESNTNKIINPFTGRCIDKNSKIAKDVFKRLEEIEKEKNRYIKIKNQLVEKKETVECKKTLNDKLHQCMCPICWIVACIASLHYSGLSSKYFKPFYKKHLDELYSIFTDYDKSEGNICPRVSKEVAKEIVSHYDEGKIDINIVANKGGHSLIFMYSFLKVALKDGYLVEAISIDTDKLNYPSNTILVADLTFDTPLNINLNFIDELALMLKQKREEFRAKGYCLKTGIFSFTEYKNNVNGHSVAWRYCDKKFYICNSDRAPCMELTSKDERIQKYIIPVYKTLSDIIFLLTKVN